MAKVKRLSRKAQRAEHAATHRAIARQAKKAGAASVKQPPPKKMSARQLRRQARANSAAIQAAPRSEALAAMGDEPDPAPPPDKKALEPTVTIIRSSAVGGAWSPPEPCVGAVKQKTESVVGLSSDAVRLSAVLDSLERLLKRNRRPHKEKHYGKARS